ncbi:hypothetical protein U1Q18_028370 [Sarracenia purpurea var. burkii]
MELRRLGSRPKDSTQVSKPKPTSSVFFYGEKIVEVGEPSILEAETGCLRRCVFKHEAAIARKQSTPAMKNQEQAAHAVTMVDAKVALFLPYKGAFDGCCEFCCCPFCGVALGAFPPGLVGCGMIWLSLYCQDDYSYAVVCLG